MALFHSHIQVISRSSGRSAVAAAAYRSGTRMTDERTGAVHDYTRKGGVAHSEVVLPVGAPDRWRDRSTLWNEAERSERGNNAQVAREIEYALPREFDRSQQIEFARDYAKTFADDGMVADFSIHDNGDGNPHCHMMLTMRPCDSRGFMAKSVNEYLVRGDGGERLMTAAELKVARGGWSKVYRYKDGRELTQSEAEAAGLHPTKDRKGKAPVQSTRYLVDWNDEGKVIEWRERLATMQNERLAAMSHGERVDHRSYAERGVDQVPTLHEGATVRQVEAREQRRASSLGYEYRPVSARRLENIRIRSLNERMKEALKLMMEKALRYKRAFDARSRSGNAAKRNQLTSARARALRQHRAQRSCISRGHSGPSK